MKRIFWIFLAVFLFSGSGDAQRIQGHGQFGLFYSSLAPHGEWISLDIGRVWRPFHVGQSWRPYSDGRWVWTDYGWYWVSYEPFGWATYHYGRWIYDDYYGWIWVPDDVWGPAWVEWRYDGNYIGWAPLPPYAHFSLSIGITFGRTWVAPVHYWNFVPCGNFSSVHVANYIQPVDFTRRIFGRTRSVGKIRSVNKRIVNEGLARDNIERRTRQRVEKVDVVERKAAGPDRITTRRNRDILEIYRPGPDVLRSEGVVRGNSGKADERNAVRTEPGLRERNTQRSLENIRKNRTSQRNPDGVRTQRQQPRIIPKASGKKTKPDGISSNADTRTVKPEERSPRKLDRSAPSRENLRELMNGKRNAPVIGRDRQTSTPRKSSAGNPGSSVGKSRSSTGQKQPAIRSNQRPGDQDRQARQVNKPATRSGKRKGDG